jgi:hypothetical protein
MALNKVEERIPARMPLEVYERIAAAAQTIGATLNQFLVQSALDKATISLKGSGSSPSLPRLRRLFLASSRIRPIRMII